MRLALEATALLDESDPADQLDVSSMGRGVVQPRKLRVREAPQAAGRLEEAG